MRAEYIIQLIQSHAQNDELKFKATVESIASEEIKKGNLQLSKKVLEAFKANITVEPNKPKKYSQSSGLVMFEPTSIVPPRDKNSNFELFDIIEPNSDLEKLVLAPKVEQKIEQIINEYNQKDKLRDLGLPVENRILLCGPPGCGKTSTAYLIANRLKLPLAYVRLDSLISSLLGQTGSNIRRIFEAANRGEIILFLDEFDAIAKKRDDKHELGELKRVVNTLLQNIDNLSENILFIAATNHENLLDPAVWRRFNSAIYLTLPDSQMRSKFIGDSLLKYNIKQNVNLKSITELTNGLNFSQIQEIILKTVKKVLIHYKSEILSTKDLIDSLKDTLLQYNENRESIDIEVIKRLNKNGLPLKTISSLTNIPRTTLYDWIKKGEDLSGE